MITITITITVTITITITTTTVTTITIVMDTDGLYNKIPAHKILARVWVAQEPICFIGSG